MTKHERIWVDENGKVLPLEECSREQLIARFRKVVDDHHDVLTARNGAIEALMSRLRSARKAKAEANKRADIAVKAMKDMLETFGK